VSVSVVRRTIKIKVFGEVAGTIGIVGDTRFEKPLTSNGLERELVSAG
jgi:hypothetical protein